MSNTDEASTAVAGYVDATRSTWPSLLLALPMLAAYVGLEWLSFLHEHNDLPVTPWNPGLGLMFAMIILRGPRMGLLLLTGGFLAQVLVVRSELPWSVLLAMSAAIAVSYTVVANLAARKLNLAPRLARTRDILILVVAGLVGALTEAVQLWLLLLATRHFDLADVGNTSVPLIVGDVIGIAVVTPLVLRAAAARLTRPALFAKPVLAELAILAIAIVLILLIVVRPPAQPGQSLFYLLFMPVVIAAVRHGIDGACAALAIAQLGLVAFLHWHGFELSRFTEYQLLMLVLTLTGLIVGGLVSERHAAQVEADASRQRLFELQAQAARSARLNMASGMAAALAHEINQPMTAARALARSVQELIRVPGDQERAERNVAAMIEQIDHAGSVVKRMRDFLRRGETHISTLDMRTVLAEAVALSEPIAGQRPLHITLAMPKSLPVVYGDRVQIGQVIINLIKNSAEAIPLHSEGRIEVEAHALDDDRVIEVAVRDNGPGIPADQILSLFEPLHGSRPDGIGLGLSICKTILQAHGGRIWLASSAAGRTEFRFTLPTGSAMSATV